MKFFPMLLQLCSAYILWYLMPHSILMNGPNSASYCITSYMSNMEEDLQSLFGLHVYSCLHYLRPRNSPPLPPHLGSYRRALKQTKYIFDPLHYIICSVIRYIISKHFTNTVFFTLNFLGHGGYVLIRLLRQLLFIIFCYRENELKAK